MDPTLAHREIRIAVKWGKDLLVRQYAWSLPADFFAPLPEHAPIRPERADAFRAALVVEIEGTFAKDVPRDAAVPTSWTGLHKLEEVGIPAPSEVGKAADSAGLAHALRHLPDGVMTPINPVQVVSYAGRPAGLETTDVAARPRGGVW